MAHKHSDIHVKLYNISHQCSLCGYNMGRISESTCEMFDYSNTNSETLDTNSETLDTKDVILVCKDCSVRRRKRNIRGYVDLRFAELSLELAVITELRRELSSVRDDPKPVHAPVEDLESLVGDRGSADKAPLDHADPRLDPTHAKFDEVLYAQWLDE